MLIGSPKACTVEEVWVFLSYVQLYIKILIKRGGGTGPVKPRQRTLFGKGVLCQFQKAIMLGR